MKRRITLVSIAIAALSTWVWVDTGKMRFRAALKADPSGSEAIVLERYYSGTVLQNTTMSAQQFNGRIESLPGGMGRLRHTFSKCWVPHHRIKFDEEKKDGKVEICFTCNEIWTEATGRRKIPEDWRQALRDLFLAQGISDTAPKSEEFLQHMDALIEEAEQDVSPQSATRSESESEGEHKPQLESEARPR